MARALVLSGGGSKGAFQVGALQTLVTQGLDFDVIAGVSTGALSAAMLAAGRLSQQVGELATLYMDLRGNGDVYHSSIFGLLKLLWSSALYDPSPIRNKLERYVVDGAIVAAGKQLRIGTVCLESGAYLSISEHSLRLLDFVMASASMPVFFPPVEILGAHYCDGGVRHVTPLADAFQALNAIQMPATMAAAAVPNEMWVILCDSVPYRGTDLSALNRGIPIAERAVDLLTSQIFADDLSNACAVNDAVKAGASEAELGGPKRYVTLKVIMPSDPGVLPDTLQFDPDLIRSAMALGRKDALKPLDQTALEARLAS